MGTSLKTQEGLCREERTIIRKEDAKSGKEGAHPYDPHSPDAAVRVLV